MHSPKVSVMMVFYNPGPDIMNALASLLYQTYCDWELIAIDDGSTCNYEPLFASLGDPRIKFHRLERNYGIPTARQIALQRSAGDYIAILDADDWMYPDRLAEQCFALDNHPDVDLVSNRVLITDASGFPIGVRPKHVHGRIETLTRPRTLQFPFCSSTFRRSITSHTKFDPQLRWASDTDFVNRALIARKFLLLPEVAHVYNELMSSSPAKVLASTRYRRRSMRMLAAQHPASSTLAIVDSFGKELVYRVAFALGQHHAVLTRRNRKPTSTELKQYEEARCMLNAAQHSLRQVSVESIHAPL